jgi:uncharacterized protein YukE
MARIKSALEIALERTESVKSDKASIDQFEAKQRGKRLANEFLEGTVTLGEEFKKASPDQREAVKRGAFDVLVSQITLPVTADDRARIESALKGLQTIIGDSRFGILIKQFTQALSQYLGEVEQYGEAIRRQYAPKLRQKEEELSRRFGRPVQIDPFQDPEFVAFYNQNMNMLKENYQDLADQVRQQAELLYPE